MHPLLKLLRKRFRHARIRDLSVYERPFYRPFDDLDSRLDLWRRIIFDRRLRTIYDRTAETIDRAHFREIQEKYQSAAETGGFAGTIKYLDLAPWIRLHSKIAHQLSLDTRPSCRVLDLGSGGGHFLAIAKAHGHLVTALDLPDNDIYSDLIALFDIPRVVGGIYLGSPLPDSIGRHDIITINAQNFDLHADAKRRWDVRDWFEFLEYLTTHHLNFPGEIFVGLNKSAGPTGREDYLWALVDAARQLGAHNKPGEPQFHFSLNTPLCVDLSILSNAENQ